MSITVTVGKVPGVAKDVTLDGAHTVAEALRIAELGSTDGYELRVNNSKTTDFNQEVYDGDIISVVKSVKGNSDSGDYIAVTVKVDTLPSQTLFVEKGTYVQGVKSLMGSAVAKEHRCYDADGCELTKNTELTQDMEIFFRIPVEEPAKKKATKKKAVEAATSDTISCTVDFRGETHDLVLPKKSRYDAVFNAIGADKKFSDYAITSDNKEVKFAFATVKNGGHIVIVELPSAETEAEAPAPAKKKKLTVRKTKAKKEDSKDESAEVCQAEPSCEDTNDYHAAPETITVECTCNKTQIIVDAVETAMTRAAEALNELSKKRAFDVDEARDIIDFISQADWAYYNITHKSKD